MINSKMICKIMGSLFFIEAGFLILCALLAIYYKETDLTAFLSSAAITAGAGIVFSIFGERRKENQPSRWLCSSISCLDLLFPVRNVAVLSERIHSQHHRCLF